MATPKTTTYAVGRGLVLERLLDAPQKKSFTPGLNRPCSNSGSHRSPGRCRLLRYTDAFTNAWEPSEKPFMVVSLTFEGQDGKTKYTARVQRWSVSAREKHEQMGFHQGWPICAKQLAELVEAH